MLKILRQSQNLVQGVGRNIGSRNVISRPLLISSAKFCSKTDLITNEEMAKYDATQVLYLREHCILVDENDQNIGQPATKKECHLLSNIRKGMLHRAFSVFLFNSQNELLLQQRSEAKITFPGLYTNTCCSHPLFNDLEMDEENATGVKRAAQRKLFHELGILPDQIPLDRFHYLTRIQYQAENIPLDGKFGENEIDYVLIVQKDVDLSINTNEVKHVQYVSQAQLQELLEQSGSGGFLVTPWFKLICDHFLFRWWDKLEKLKDFQDHQRIHKLS